MNIGEDIRLIRVSLKLSQSEIAIILGISQEVYSKIERGITKKIPHEVIEKAKKELGLVVKDSTDYITERRNKKNTDQPHTLEDYTNVMGNANPNSTEVMPAKKSSGIIVSELFKGSKYVIRIAGNSMTPLYPPGGLLGIKPVDMINPGGVYVIESYDGQLWIKRMFYKDDNQETAMYQLVSDNNMKHEIGPRSGKLFYPDFFISVKDVKNLFVVTGVFKSNIITVINEN